MIEFGTACGTLVCFGRWSRASISWLPQGRAWLLLRCLTGCACWWQMHCSVAHRCCHLDPGLPRHRHIVWSRHWCGWRSPEPIWNSAEASIPSSAEKLGIWLLTYPEAAGGPPTHKSFGCCPLQSTQWWIGEQGKATNFLMLALLWQKAEEGQTKGKQSGSAAVECCIWPSVAYPIQSNTFYK